MTRRGNACQCRAVRIACPAWHAGGMTLMTAWFFISVGTIACAMALRDIFTREVTARELLLLAFFTWTPRLACGGGPMPLLGSLSGAAVLWGLTTLARLFGRRDVIGQGD
ncbi:MAG: hypothetical protein ACOYH4_06540, partial [Saccharofermentanales bacterium]